MHCHADISGSIRVTGAHSTRWTIHLTFQSRIEITLYKIKSNNWLSLILTQIPEQSRGFLREIKDVLKKTNVL